MKSLAVVALFTLGLGVAQASDFVAVYALIDKVTFEPSADKPERIQISGVFAIASPMCCSLYQPAQRGYLYFTLPATKPDLARMEWADLKAVAGTHQVVSFGVRTLQEGLRVRKSDEKPSAPDVYVLGNGITPDRSNTDYPPIKSLFDYR
jgi:hypothetical protein